VQTLVTFEKRTERIMTIVKVGIREMNDPGLEVKKAWLPVETQVITRDIANFIKRPEIKGFRVTFVYPGSTAEKAGLQVGDMIYAVDTEKMTASEPENYEELGALIRQYRVGDTTELSILRGEQDTKLTVELERAPRLDREMKSYRDENFEFAARDITFFDRAKEKWAGDLAGVLIEEVTQGSWAAVAGLTINDLIVAIDGNAVGDVEALRAAMKTIAGAKPKSLVFKVIRGIHEMYVEVVPKWDNK
jgi:S1-C subfamily serine protease